MDENHPDTQQTSWLKSRTIEEETRRDIMVSISFKYFKVIIAAIFAILLAKPEIASQGWMVSSIPIRSVIFWYMFLGLIGLFVYEALIMIAKKDNSEIQVPFLFILLFGLYAAWGFILFFELFHALLEIGTSGMK